LQTVRKVDEHRGEEDVLHVGDELHLLDQLMQAGVLVQLLQARGQC
jgi:hypothetical protein